MVQSVYIIKCVPDACNKHGGVSVCLTQPHWSIVPSVRHDSRCHQDKQCRGCAYLQFAIAQALLGNSGAASAVHPRCPQVHTSHVAVDVQKQDSFNIIWQAQRLPVTDHLIGQSILYLILQC